MPSVQNHIEAVQQFLVLNNWRFVVLIVEQGDEGTEISETFRAWAKLTRICVEVSITLDEMIDNKHIIHLLLSPTTPKVTVVFASKDKLLELVRSIKASNATNRFVWIGNDDLLEVFNTGNLQPGTFIVKYKIQAVPEFQHHFKQLNLTNKNPWFRQAVGKYLQCDNHDCLENVLASYVTSGSQIVPLIYDSVWTFANAVASLLAERCPNRKGQEALRCFKHHRDFFFGHLKTVSDGVTKKSKKFDDDGFVNGLLSIDQIVSSSKHTRPQFDEVATFDTMAKQLKKIKDFSVEYFKFDPAILAIDYKCQKPCARDEYMAGTSKSINQAECCWVCKKCLDNERVSDDGKHCEECPHFHWPAHLEKESVCLPLPTDYFSWYDPLPATLIVVSLVGVIFAVCLILIYWFNRKLDIIKASSIELSIVQLVSIIIGYVAVPVFLQKPSVVTCSIAHCFFSLSFNILYLGMLIKAVRVFRIFQTCRNEMRIKYTSPTFQLIMTLSFVVLEVRIIVTGSICPT
ncbi:unnamed protein product [Lymnaea stagnalis]|uniref:G-protein coupled receptors family 3 profile domain-containing protein n=1 Tax=Lymnaea stagnalis TaxID=6523 RepID=A0AAV2IBB5_LYMST